MVAGQQLASRPSGGVATQTGGHLSAIGWLKGQKDELMKISPGGSQSVERMITVISQITMSNDYAANKIKECSAESIYGALKECLLRGLHLGGPSGMGHAALVPYKGICQLDINYQGLLHEARKSGCYRTIFAKVVYKGDSFRVWTDAEGEHFEHQEDITQPRSDDTLEFVYAVAIEKESGLRFEYMTREDIDYTEKVTRKKDMSDPWKKWYREMAKKTVLKRLGKMLDRVPELASAMDVDNLQFKETKQKAMVIDNETQNALPSGQRIESMLE